jgi:indole-3-glycerol phosphate synthase
MTRPSLEGILAVTRQRVSALGPRARELERAAAQAAVPPRFDLALRQGGGGGAVGVIAEIKRRSPAAGVIREELDPVELARAYAAGGAIAVSVLTDAPHFGGSLDDLARVTRAVAVPALRKDFILDELQLLEARVAGASAVLLIARILDAKRLAVLAGEARRMELGVLVEIHNAAELDWGLSVKPTAVGVNSRDLDSFAVDFGVAEALLPLVPADLPAVAESGIETRADIERLARAGADAVLVGTSLARADDPAAAVRALCGVPRRGRGRS